MSRLNESIYAPRKYEKRYRYNRHQELTHHDVDIDDKDLLNTDDNEDQVRPDANERDAEIIESDKNVSEDHPMGESTDDSPGGVEIFGFNKTRTRDDIREEHLRANAPYYNYVFYSIDPASTIKMVEELPFLDYFYPNFKRLNLFARIHGTIGGLAIDPEVYKNLRIRMPFTEDKSNLSATPEYTMEELDDLKLYLEASYTVDYNWYMVDAFDINHIIFCLKLYSILDEILNNPYFTITDLTAYHTDLLMEWQERVLGAYDELKTTKNWYKVAQVLHDLCWYPLDNPESPDDIAACRIAFVNAMASSKNKVQNMNESGEIRSKEDTVAYLVKELGLGDECFLVPSSFKHPVFSKGSVKMAMDYIDRVDPEDIAEYVKNLNRKYREFRCNFSISIDHPYAKYADKSIIDNMTRVLAEGDTAVNDHGTSTGNPVEGDAWYNVEETRGQDPDHDFYPDRNLGPNTHKDDQKDFTKHYSIM